jgi:hypothetical protein
MQLKQCSINEDILSYKKSMIPILQPPTCQPIHTSDIFFVYAKKKKKLLCVTTLKLSQTNFMRKFLIFALTIQPKIIILLLQPNMVTLLIIQTIITILATLNITLRTIFEAGVNLSCFFILSVYACSYCSTLRMTFVFKKLI